MACDATDRLKTTGRSHHRVMILEVMGPNAGRIEDQIDLEVRTTVLGHIQREAR